MDFVQPYGFVHCPFGHSSVIGICAGSPYTVAEEENESILPGFSDLEQNNTTKLEPEEEDETTLPGFAEEEETEDEENARVKRSSQQSAPKKTFSKVVPINPTSSSRIKIMRPSDINDSTNVANEIKEGRLVIFDVGQIDNEEARRIVDFMSGAAYGVNGKVRRVSEGIFVAAPKNIDIAGDTMKEHVKNGMDWNFM